MQFVITSDQHEFEILVFFQRGNSGTHDNLGAKVAAHRIERYYRFVSHEVVWPAGLG
jgi:hypothetical protein